MKINEKITNVNIEVGDTIYQSVAGFCIWGRDFDSQNGVSVNFIPNAPKYENVLVPLKYLGNNIFEDELTHKHILCFRSDTICEEFTEKGSIDKYKKRAILGIQDLGSSSEPIESLYMGNRMGVIQQLLEYRGDFTDKITLITSNLPMSHKVLIDRYGDRVASRLNEMCNYFEIKGKDRRKI